MHPPRRPRHASSPGIAAVEWAWLLDLGPPTEDDGPAYWELEHDVGTRHVFRDGRPAIPEIIARWGRQALAEYARRHPGRKPSWWWKHR